MKVIGNVFAYIFKNLGIITGVAEAVIKVAAGVVSLTPSKADDAIVAAVDKGFSVVKKWLYTISNKLAGKEITPNA